MDAAVRAPGRALPVIILSAVAIAVLAIVLVVLRGDRTAAYPPGSPEAAYQAFLVACQERDGEAAYDLLSRRVQASWPKSEYLSEFGMRMQGQGTRVLIESGDEDGDRATLRVAVEFYYGGGLTSSRSRQTFDVRLLREDGAWRIDERLAWVGPVGW